MKKLERFEMGAAIYAAIVATISLGWQVADYRAAAARLVIVGDQAPGRYLDFNNSGKLIAGGGRPYRATYQYRIINAGGRATTIADSALEISCGSGNLSSARLKSGATAFKIEAGDSEGFSTEIECLDQRELHYPNQYEPIALTGSLRLVLPDGERQFTLPIEARPYEPIRSDFVGTPPLAPIPK